MIPKLEEYKKNAGLTSTNAIKPGLAAIESAMIALGSPQENLTAIHVAGTNGKGSTIAFMESILRAAGYRVGVFASPAMIDIHDQIRIDGHASSPEQLQASFQTVQQAGLDGQLTDFELLTAVAFVTFDRLQPDIVLVECGMGGRFDSTNVITPLVSVVTSIALDHVAFLGDTIAEIAWHKAGIFKKGIPAVCGQLSDSAIAIASTQAFEQNSPLRLYGRDFHMHEAAPEYYEGSVRIPLNGRGLKGPHQAINAAVAIDALLTSEFAISEDAIRQGIAETHLSYRFEQVAPNVFFDGAHNPAAAHMLAQTIRQQFPGERVDFIMGMMANKDVKETLNPLIPVALSSP